MRIDAIRIQIEQWSASLKPAEKALLLADLVRAANGVSNIAGTYGCYLKHWKARALTPLRLEPCAIEPGGSEHEVTCMDAAEVASHMEVDIAYADPPYTKRQYSAYYHIPETIVLYDSPQLDGSTGLRPWREKQSAWCYRRKATGALTGLLDTLKCEWFFLSYSEDGHMQHGEIMEILGSRGEVSVYEKEARRYKSAARPHRGNDVLERLYSLRRR